MRFGLPKVVVGAAVVVAVVVVAAVVFATVGGGTLRTGAGGMPCFFAESCVFVQREESEPQHCCQHCFQHCFQPAPRTGSSLQGRTATARTGLTAGKGSISYLVSWSIMFCHMSLETGASEG